jgi:undecaprenyl-diphosphatase
MVSLSALSSWDAATCLRVNTINRLRAGRTLFAIASRLGDGAVWWILMATLPLVYGVTGLHESVLMACNGAAATLAYRYIKQRTRRPRPSDVYASLLVTVAPLDRFSFPSGHTLHAVAFTILAWHFHPDLAWIFAPFAGLVAFSRVVLGLHYPSDVAAGAALGACFSLTTIELSRIAATG